MSINAAPINAAPIVGSASVGTTGQAALPISLSVFDTRIARMPMRLAVGFRAGRIGAPVSIHVRTTARAAAAFAIRISGRGVAAAPARVNAPEYEVARRALDGLGQGWRAQGIFMEQATGQPGRARAVSGDLVNRWVQDITTTYELTLTAMASQAAYGTLDDARNAHLSYDYDEDAWTAEGRIVQKTAPDTIPETETQAALETLLMMARRDILSSHRGHRVRFLTALDPALDVAHSYRVDAADVTVAGKARSVAPVATAGAAAAAGMAASDEADASWLSKLARSKNMANMNRQDVIDAAKAAGATRVSERTADLVIEAARGSLQPISIKVGPVTLTEGDGLSRGYYYMAANEDRVADIMRTLNLKPGDDPIGNMNAVIEKWRKMPARREGDRVIFGKVMPGQRATGLLLDKNGEPATMFTIIYGGQK